MFSSSFSGVEPCHSSGSASSQKTVPLVVGVVQDANAHEYDVQPQPRKAVTALEHLSYGLSFLPPLPKIAGYLNCARCLSTLCAKRFELDSDEFD
jgi:hypothetical protein